MKKQLLSIMAVLATGFAMAQSIPNGGFENWTSQTCFNPQFYGTSNLQIHGGSNTPGPINVIRTTDSYVDSFAVNLTTTLVGTDTSTAYILNFNPGNGGAFTGGIPYNQKPTSLHYYYKCNIMPGDTALILVLFKKAGTTFSQNIQKITGTQSTYSLGVMSLNLLGITPDTLMFAAISSNILGNNSKGIPGSMLQLDSVNFWGVSGQPADMNGDFENWQTVLTNPTLNGWGGVGYNSINNQTTDKYAGTYALELKSTLTNQTNDSVYTSNITTGYSISNGTGGGYPYALTADTLKFYYKYTPGGTSDDSASVQLNFKKNGVFVAYQTILLPAAASYTQAVLSYSLAQTPDTVLVFINSSKRWLLPISYLGSDLKIDNMYFASQASPVTSFTLPATGCTGQVIQLTDMSGNSPTSWTWTASGGTLSDNNAQNPSVAYTTNGTFTVTLVAANTVGSNTISNVITVNPSPTISSQSDNYTVCEGNAGTFTVSSSNSTDTYQWYWSAFGMMAADDGTFGEVNYNTNIMTINDINNGDWGPSGQQMVFCVVTNSLNCTAQSQNDTIFINSFALPTVAITASSASVCIGATATLTANGANTYTWSNTGATTTSITPSPTVTIQYTVTGTDGNGCMNMDTLSVVVITCGTGINQLSGSDVSIYPNPSNGVFTIKGTSELNNLQIVNELGQVIKTISLKQTNNYEVSLTGLDKGVYFLIGNSTKQRFIVIN